MAMTVMYNAGVQLSLDELNKNINKADKAWAKVSSEMKINSTQDDASSYSISKRYARTNSCAPAGQSQTFKTARPW